MSDFMPYTLAVSSGHAHTTPNDIRALFSQRFRAIEEDRRRRLKARDRLLDHVPPVPGEGVIQRLDRIETAAIANDPELSLRLGEEVRLGALLFARPYVDIVKGSILPAFDYWDRRSAEHVDIALVGWQKPSEEDRDFRFDQRDFAKAVELFERETRWRYSGGTDLLLLNTRYSVPDEAAVFDYTTVVSLTIEDALKDGAIKSVGGFFEDLVSFASRSNGRDPAWGFSDSMGLKEGRSFLAQLVLKILPRDVRAEYQKLKHFVVRDVAAT